MKTCSKCKQSKPLEDFHKDKGGRLGVRADCKVCRIAQVLISYRRNPQPAIERAIMYNKTHPEQRRRNDQVYYLRRMADPEIRSKERARTAAWKREHRAYENARFAAYRAVKLQATPSWADMSKIKSIYAQCPKGMEVDHIIPLQGDNVCGLHVEYNLQYLTRSENASKSNKVLEVR